MKCEDVQTWLLAAKSRGELPEAVQAHLGHCSDCEQQWQQLERIDEQVRQIAPPPASDSGKEQLWRRLDRMPRAAHLPFPPQRRPAWVLLASTAAASLLVGLLVGLAWEALSPRRGAGRVATPPPHDSAARAIVSRVAEHDVRLAAAVTPAAQLDAVARMADDLRAEAFRLARLGTRDELVSVAHLYDQVVLRGVAGRVQALPAAERPEQIPPLLRQFRSAAAEVASLSADLLPAVAELLHPVGKTAREGAAFLESDQKKIERQPVPFPAGGVQSLLAGLVLCGLRLAEEPDPMRRADISSEVAQQLAPAIVLLAANGETEEASKLGSTFGALLDHGVAGNLDGAEQADLMGSRRAEAEQVRENAAQAATVLERNLQKAPPAARKALERALKASEHGRERAIKGGKRKGKEKPFVPPGQRGKAPR